MIRELRTLIAVAREGTFAAAAQKIGLTQAAVSAQIARLEADIGVRLFDRTGRTAVLTPTGHRTLLQAQEMVTLYQNLGSPAPEPQPPRMVTLGAIASAQRTLLPGALAGFHGRYPDVRTRVLPGLSMTLLDQLDAGDIDMAVIINPAFSLQSDLRWTPIAREPYRLLVPRDTPDAHWRDLLASQPFIRYDRASFGGRQVDRFLRSLPVVPQERCELDELEAITELVAKGIGVALVPQTLGHQGWPESVRAMDLGKHGFHRDIGLVHRPERTLSDLARILAGLIESSALKLGENPPTKAILPGETQSPTDGLKGIVKDC
ncbi:LysR family transcriptional regulator [Pseudomonas sp. DC3000-4b1]|uniref:LysR family transcriptional regulator n=1 Tax=unclassified Pseudomonas TaxID=196821 RepID=UPI003CEF5493